MRELALAALLLTLAAPANAADPVAEARRLYNLGQYDAAERLAREALVVPARADAGRVVLGRIQLERFRRSADPVDLEEARASLRSLNPAGLDSRERVELMIGLAEALYLEDRFGASAELFESVLERSAALGASAHERVLDWWATAIDRQAQTLPMSGRVPLYSRVFERMRAEILAFPGSAAAGYWLAASLRASGEPDAAWHFAIAGWLRAALATDRGAALRADLDRLVVQAIIPERAIRLAAKGDTKTATASMLSEWEAFKAEWSK
jgi:tetratricopeptide (TPR) repeat protein